MTPTMMVDPPSPFATEAEQKAFLQEMATLAQVPGVKRAVAFVRGNLKERLFDPATYAKG